MFKYLYIHIVILPNIMNCIGGVMVSMLAPDSDHNDMYTATDSDHNDMYIFF